jgi:hypothetical protein
VSAVISSAFPANLLHSKHASVYNVSASTTVVDLLVTISFLNREVTTQLLFKIFHEHLGFDIVLGSQWQAWCALNKGQLISSPYS